MSQAYEEAEKQDQVSIDSAVVGEDKKRGLKLTKKMPKIRINELWT